MSNVLLILAAICGLGVLMVVHEGGHYFAARAFGMRVTKFSIGLAPVLWRFQPKGSPTTFQIGAIPFFAYVQIDGMNPLEKADTNDKQSYANASLIGRIVTIMAGSVANYVFASLFFVCSILLQGKPNAQMIVQPLPNQPAAQAGVLDGDRVIEANATPVETWDQFRRVIVERAGQATALVVLRHGERVELTVTPAPTGEKQAGQVGVRLASVPVPFPQACKAAVLMPPEIIADLLRGIGRLITGKQKAELGGPVAIVKEGAKAARLGMGELLFFLGYLSTHLAGFNLLPIPALDGGRLMFLIYEAISRRRPDALVEAQIHLVGFVMLLALMMFVTYSDIFLRH